MNPLFVGNMIVVNPKRRGADFSWRAFEEPYPKNQNGTAIAYKSFVEWPRVSVAVGIQHP